MSGVIQVTPLTSSFLTYKMGTVGDTYLKELF